MKNRNSYRLIAWLTALVMMLNMMPLSASAVDDMPSNQEPSPELETIDGYSIIKSLSTGTPPGDQYGSFKVYYVVKGSMENM